MYGTFRTSLTPKLIVGLIASSNVCVTHELSSPKKYHFSFELFTNNEGPADANIYPFGMYLNDG